MHDFDRSLAASHKASDLPIWEQIYRRAFADFLCMADHRKDGEHQRAGIDRSLILENSKQILVDEKARFRDFGDIALEYISNTTRGTPGWVCKPLRADYIAYAIVPVGRCYLLPVQQLQAAWRANADEWLRRKKIRAPNPGYDTLSVGVTPKELFAAMGKALRVSFDPPVMRQEEHPSA